MADDSNESSWKSWLKGQGLPALLIALFGSGGLLGLWVQKSNEPQPKQGMTAQTQSSSFSSTVEKPMTPPPQPPQVNQQTSRPGHKPVNHQIDNNNKIESFSKDPTSRASTISMWCKGKPITDKTHLNSEDITNGPTRPGDVEWQFTGPLPNLAEHLEIVWYHGDYQYAKFPFTKAMENRQSFPDLITPGEWRVSLEGIPGSDSRTLFTLWVK